MHMVGFLSSAGGGKMIELKQEHKGIFYLTVGDALFLVMNGPWARMFVDNLENSSQILECKINSCWY